MPGAERLSAGDGRDVRVFGIRHLSPTGAYRLRAYLDRVRPQLVLVEGPSDATELIALITARGVVPPIAILAYTDRIPIQTLVFPLASYSPEYQAFLWAAENGARAAFIDLPSDAAVVLHERARRPSAEAEAGAEAEAEADAGRRDYYRRQHGLYERIAELAGEHDYESYWERHFEHNREPGSYRESIAVFSAEMRSLLADEERLADPHEAAYNAIRESYMRRRIREAMAEGCDPDRIVVVTGAYHASTLSLGSELPAMTDRELRELPRASTKLTLMPYSYYKLSSHSGYGAGNPAPAYFELMWHCMRSGEAERLPALYLSAVAASMREEGTFRSTASVIEAVRLAESLASLRGGSMPTWKDLRDAAVVCLGFGELSAVAEALTRADVGTAIGSLPEGVSQTPIQDDFNRHLKKLKLEKYKSAVAQDLELDLRENRRVQSEEAALLDLNRSTLLHRLRLLDIGFARKQPVKQDGATWAEHWVLQWTPEAEIRMVESTLKGETIEWAAAFVIQERLDACRDIREASRIVREACECGLPEAMDGARATLQRLAVDSGSFAQLAGAAHELSVLLRYGDVRRMDTASLEPLLAQLFLRAALLLVEAAACSDEASGEIVGAMNELHAVSQEHFELVDDALWLRRLSELAARDDRNAKLSGLAFAILLERNEAEDERIAQEVSRRLSPGIPADIGAGWFEGLSMRNRYALLSRSVLWKQLDEYIRSLDDDQFRRALVFLRRAFGSFEAREKTSLAETMGELWGLGGLQSADLLQRPLSEEERGKLDELNEFDFGDL
ncbi:DUF5682 family protein [Paenibacillus flagellatus]|uniref:Uncharacterized protein n=1 Tax=Paenibacillus flagellatus TaxID=2211139 RepID=A0A2V5KJ09_9BACL|nr:DUF5682 family protein [Paenibacillus flagellatus]PYI50317.1 hypothetical protein DLM86_30065 [Paenibacillus flagellatus]